MNITGLSHLFKWENLHNWWLTKYFFAPLYFLVASHSRSNGLGPSESELLLHNTFPLGGRGKKMSETVT